MQKWIKHLEEARRAEVVIKRQLPHPGPSEQEKAEHDFVPDIVLGVNQKLSEVLQDLEAFEWTRR